MKFIDTFDKPSDAWVRGAATPSQKAKWPEISDGENENHVTLSGRSVNPACFGEFKASLRFTFPKEEPGYVAFGFGKPYEWSSTAESGLRITIHREGTGTVTGPDGATIAEFTLSGDSEGIREFRVEKTGDRLEVKTPEDTVAVVLPEDTDTAGYFSIQVEKTPVRLREFRVESPVDAPPLTAEERQAGIDAWKQRRMRANHKNLAEFREYVRHSIAEGRWGYDTTMSVSPGLVKSGETVTATFTSKNKPLASSATMEPDYLGAKGGTVRELKLQWQVDETGRHIARVEISADIPGNCRVVWKVNGERLVRVFGVVEPGYTVCTLWIGTNFPPIDREIHQYDLHGEYWVGDWWSPFDKTPQAVLDFIQPLANFYHSHGDVLVPFVNAQWILPGIPNFNVFDLDADLQAEGFMLVRDFVDVLEIGPMDLLGSYTMGHDTPAAAARAGAKGLTSLCVWQNLLDGCDENCWKINHWGSPIVPYYLADDDFRKVAPGKGILGFNMGTASSVRNYSVFCLEGCPTNVIPMRRYTSDGVIPANIHRFYYAVESWLHDAANNAEPLFVTAALENFVGREEWRQANELAVEYLVRRAREAKLVFATSADVAEYYLEHYDVQPEHIFYQPDVYCGLKPDVKPALLPDRIEFSNRLCHSLHIDGQFLPQILWDFTSPWKNEEWEDKKDIRLDNGLIPPELVLERGCVPKNVDLKNVDVNVTTETADGTCTITMTIETPSSFRLLPISLWRLPLAPENLTVTVDSADVSWRSVVDGFTGNLNGLLLFENVSKGRSVATLKLEGAPAQPRNLVFELGDSIRGREVTMNRRTCVYLWRADARDEVSLELTFPTDRTVYAVSADGHKVTPDENGLLSISFTNRWQREFWLLYGASRDDISFRTT
ncbi:MAG: hypothetical protein JXA11_11405 [Phycisphaerae bacterium]|nr:hypothetical protein [Phycisphaerae bacterium]